MLRSCVIRNLANVRSLQAEPKWKFDLSKVRCTSEPTASDLKRKACSHTVQVLTNTMVQKTTKGKETLAGSIRGPVFG